MQLDGGQAQAALDPVLALEAIEGYNVEGVAGAVKALAGKLDGAQAQAALGWVLAGIQGTTYPDDLRALAQAVQALPVQLDAAQAQAALGPVLAAIKDRADEARFSTLAELHTLAQAVQALARKVDGAQAQAALALRPGLAWAPTSEEAAGWAGVLVALLPREKPEICLAEIVEALKYPTSAGAATDVLLDALHGIDPNAPGKEAGLAANLAWLTTAYPAIDLDAPPLCPPPLLAQQDVTCPVRGA